MTNDHNDLLKRISTRIRARRKELGLTQEELAGTECTKGFISQIEQGQAWPSLRTLAHIAKCLGRPVEWFVAEDSAYRTTLDEIAREVGVEPHILRDALARILNRL